MQFHQYQSTRHLFQLSLDPFDLTQALTPERLAKYVVEAGGYKLLYGTERVDENVVRELGALAEESRAVDWMEKMQCGARVNRLEGFPSEDRPVLHTAVRDFFSSSPKTEQAQCARGEFEKLREFEPTFQRFSNLILVGIGGSDLGPRANYYALQSSWIKGRSVHFVSNVDPDDAHHVLSFCDLQESVVVVVSKSGTTGETATNESLLRRAFEEKGLDPKEHFISVTGEGSPMDDQGCYLKRFYIWDWVGGRYASTSMVGGVLITFACGIAVYEEMLKGAHEMDEVALLGSPQANLPLFLALLGIWNRNFLGFPTLALIPYSQPLFRYAAHIQQVDMESNGKRVDRFGNSVDFETGPVVWGEPGTNAQHSFFQLLHQGTEVVPVEFIAYAKGVHGKDFLYEGTSSYQKLLANLFAQAIALATGKESENPNQVFPGNRPSHTVLGEQLTPRSLGALLSLYEHKIAFQGFIWGINSFDQEGVQLGKNLAKRVLDAYRDPSLYPLGGAFLSHLSR